MIIEAFLNFNPATIPYHLAVVPVWQTLKSIDITLSDGRTCLLEIGIGSACIIALNRVLVHHTLDGVEVLAGIPLAVILIVIIEAILW